MKDYLDYFKVGCSTYYELYHFLKGILNCVRSKENDGWRDSSVVKAEVHNQKDKSEENELSTSRHMYSLLFF